MHSAARIVFWALLLILTLVGAIWAIGHFSGGYRQFWALTRPIALTQWLVLIAATAIYYLLDYVRLYTLFALLGVRIPISLGLRLTCVTYFVSTLTPTSELNIPALMLLLRKRGIPASTTAAVAIVKTFYVTLWIVVFGFATLITQRDVQLPPAISDHIVLLTTPAAILIALFLAVMFFPQRTLAWTSLLRSDKPAAKWWNGFVDGLHHCAMAIAQVGLSRHPLHLVSHAACILFVLAYVFIGAYLCAVLGIPVSGGKALTAFSNSLLVSYLSPVPGGIGVAEVMTSYFLDPAMTDRGMVVSTLLRFLCSYVVVVPGIVLLVDAIREIGWRQLRNQWTADKR